MSYINRCQAKILTSDLCPSEAHEKMVIEGKEVSLCSHHMRVIAAKLDYSKSLPKQEENHEDRNLQN